MPMCCYSAIVQATTLSMCVSTINANTVSGRSSCPFKRVDARFEYPDLMEPTLLTHAVYIKDADTEPESIAKLFKNTTVQYTRHAQLQSVTGVLPNAESMEFSDWIGRMGTGTIPGYIFNWCTGECARRAGKLATLPVDLMGLSKLWFLTIGKQGRGIHMHHHGATWAAQLVGTKTWEFRTGDQPPARCMQRKGEVVFLPFGVGHGTYNHGWSLAIGSQWPSNEEVNPEERRALHVSNAAIFQNNASAVCDQVNKMDKQMATFVFLGAVWLGHADILKRIEDAKVPLVLRRMEDAWLAAARMGHAQVLPILQRIDKAAKERIYRAALKACQSGHVAMVSALLDARAVLKKNTIPMIARHGHVDLLQFVVNARMSPEQRKEAAEFTQKSFDEDSPHIQGAREESHHQIMKILREG